MYMQAAVALVLGLLTAISTLTNARAADGEIAVVAAENFYGDVAKQIGGDRVSVESIISNPDQDPHLFETSPSVVRQIGTSQIVVYNGLSYDAWMENLLKAVPQSKLRVISVGSLRHKKSGDNPHLWYDPGTMPAVAEALADALAAIDPSHKANYAERLQAFRASLQPLSDKIASIRSKYSGVSVTATEPVFGYMAEALNLTMLNQRFQLAVMNDTEPSARDVAAFQRDLQTRKVRVLFYNKQASSNIVQHLLELARAAKVPVVGVTETGPPGMSYQDWMLMQLDETEKALAGKSSRQSRLGPATHDPRTFNLEKTP
jgi:zinc/manganese transport system substrate-binding protein